jgi:MoxR-like ATPase
VQSALLEAMQERQVTLGDGTHKLPDPFLVFATQNPIEQEAPARARGPVDRFLLKAKVDYPKQDEERQIFDRMSASCRPCPVLRADTVQQLVRRTREIYIDRAAARLHGGARLRRAGRRTSGCRVRR